MVLDTFSLVGSLTLTGDMKMTIDKGTWILASDKSAIAGFASKEDAELHLNTVVPVDLRETCEILSALVAIGLGYEGVLDYDPNWLGKEGSN